ncbi:MAG: methionine adenosyltransferase [Candidatus Geothermarchaeota archaeon]
MIKVIEELVAKPVIEHQTELVERKGLGHPDYIIDLACEAVSRKLCEYYLNNYGVILHHNVDKGLLVGGRAIPRFGGGEVLEPIEIIVAGRAVTYIEERGESIPVDKIAVKAIKDVIRSTYRFLDPDRHVVITPKIRQGSIDLVSLFKKGTSAVPLANDTSFGVSYAPLTPAERLTLDIERYLNSSHFKKNYPFTGEDVKVMTLRHRNTYYITVAIAFIDRFFNNVSDYLSAKDEIRRELTDFIITRDYVDLSKESVKLMINTADMPNENVIYITVTGTSAEAGDDGNTGRSNRVNGLITPNRYMSLEATAGKNPISHVGKIYNVLANKLSTRIYTEIENIREVYVVLLSRIGEPITNPQFIHVKFIPEPNANIERIKTHIDRILDEELDLDRLRKLAIEIINGEHMLF